MELELDEHITTIIGPNDVGKSAIIRALYWLSFNKPSGASFIKHGKSSCKVSLELDDFVISRKKSDNENTYLLKENNQEKEYKSFSTKVPEEIELLLNLGDINFQKQLDPPFWFTLTGGEVSKEINSIISLSKIDSTLYKLAQEVKKSKMSITITQERAQQAEHDIKENQWVVEAEKELDLIDSLVEKQQECIKSINILYKIIKDIEELETYIEKETKRLRLLNLDIYTMEDTAYKIKEKTERIEKLEGIITQISNLEVKECDLKKSIEGHRRRIEELTGQECPLCEQPIKSLPDKKKH